MTIPPSRCQKQKQSRPVCVQSLCFITVEQKKMTVSSQNPCCVPEKCSMAQPPTTVMALNWDAKIKASVLPGIAACAQQRHSCCLWLHTRLTSQSRWPPNWRGGHILAKVQRFTGPACFSSNVFRDPFLKILLLLSLLLMCTASWDTLYWKLYHVITAYYVSCRLFQISDLFVCLFLVFVWGFGFCFF